MKMLVCFLIFSMLSGASELLTVIAGDFIKGWFGRVSSRLQAGQATTLAQTGLMTGSEAVMAPDARALEREEAGSREGRRENVEE